MVWELMKRWIVFVVGVDSVVGVMWCGVGRVMGSM